MKTVTAFIGEKTYLLAVPAKATEKAVRKAFGNVFKKEYLSAAKQKASVEAKLFSEAIRIEGV